MTKKKKGHQKFFGDRRNFLRNVEIRNFFGRRVKKGRSKILAKIWPPVCEVLDPLDLLVVRGFLPSAIAVSRLRRLIPISPPKQKIPAPLAPQTKNPRTATETTTRKE